MHDKPQGCYTMGYDHPTTPTNDCPQLPGTILRINIPAGAVINLLNLIELTSPGGICLIIRLPFLGGSSANNLSSIMNSIRQSGGTVEVVNN